MTILKTVVLKIRKIFEKLNKIMSDPYKAEKLISKGELYKI